ncbi:hypothetical protein DSECCO2_304330 [anaerobic digester metagenome]
MKNLPAPRSCAAAARPASAHLIFPLIAPRPSSLCQARSGGRQRMVEEGSFFSKASFNSGCSNPTHAAGDSPVMAKQAAQNDPSRFAGLGGMYGGLPMADERNLMERACLDKLARQLKLDPSCKMKRERQARHEHV